MWQMALLQLIHFGANAFSLWPHGGWCGWHDLSLQLSTVSSGGQSRLRSDSPTAKTQKVGCWHSNDSRNTDHTYEGLGCVWQEDVRSGRKGRVCLEECNKQANTLRTKKLRYRIYDRYRWEPRRHTHSHTDVWRQAGPLWVSPSCDTILFCYLTEGQQLVEGGKGEKDTPLLGWRETRKREPSPAPLFFLKKNTFRLPTPLQTCHTQANTLAWNHEVMYFNVYAQFHSRHLSFFTGRAYFPGSVTVKTTTVHCLHNSLSTWNTGTFTLDSATRPLCEKENVVKTICRILSFTHESGCFLIFPAQHTVCL